MLLIAVVLELTGRSSEPAGRGLEPAGRGLEPDGRGWDPAGRASEPVGQASEPAGRSILGYLGDINYTEQKLAYNILFSNLINNKKSAQQVGLGYQEVFGLI